MNMLPALSVPLAALAGAARRARWKACCFVLCGCALVACSSTRGGGRDASGADSMAGTGATGPSSTAQPVSAPASGSSASASGVKAPPPPFIPPVEVQVEPPPPPQNTTNNTAGTSGTAGIPGDAGTSGSTGTSGSAGIPGIPGIPGIAGLPGIPGTTATPSPSGPAGPLGSWEVGGRGRSTSAAAPPPAQLPAAGSALPAFPWPPPAASAFVAIPLLAVLEGWRSRHYWPPYTAGSSIYLNPTEIADFFRHEPSLAHADHALRYLLAAAGYLETSYYAVPGGFALVSRIESIEANGRSRPPPGRWEIQMQGGTGGFSLGEYLKRLFTAPAGYYRILVFVLTPVDFHFSAAAVSQAQAQGWLRSGGVRLPAEVGQQPFTSEFNTVVLIYEFEKSDVSQPANLRVPGRLPATTHLQGAGLSGISP